ncbi:MAG: amidohydrolase family protein [bacterium]|nr:amidohydrolase family protein [bacterium]
MIIDSHCHLKHGNKERTEYSPKQIVAVMDEAGIDQTVVFAMCTSSSHAIAMAHAAHRAFPDRLIPYAYALPHIGESALAHVAHAIGDLGFPGIKVHGGEVRLADYIIDPVFDLAARSEVPCLVDFVGKAEDCRRIAEAFPKTAIIVAHFGQYLTTNRDLIDQFIGLAETYENLILDTSGVVLSWKICEAVRRIGSDRITFGIDGPHPYPTLAEFAREEIAKIHRLPISDMDRQNLFHNTLARLLKRD